MTSTPSPPLLVVHNTSSFWVEPLPIEMWTATLQALREGCFLASHCYDTAGNLWPILDVKVSRTPSLVERFFPWRRVPVRTTLGEPTAISVADMTKLITQTLDSEEHEFSDTTQDEIRQRLLRVKTPVELIKITGDYA